MFSSDTKVEVLPDQLLYLLSPPISNDAPTEDAIIRGHIRLTLTKPKRIGTLIVTLDNTYQVTQDLYTKTVGTLFSKLLALNLGQKLYHPGSHDFSFAFILPASCPGSENSHPMRIKTVISATVDAYSRNSTGLKRSYQGEREIKIIVNAPGPSVLPDGLDLYVEQNSPALGPFCAEAFSESLTIASLLDIKFTFPSPAKHCEIRSISGEIIQETSINCKDALLDRLSLFRRLYPVNAPNSTKHGPFLGRIVPGEHIEVGVTARLPDETRLRTSTLETTRSVLKTSHTISFTIRYVVNKEPFVVTIKKPIQIASCCCTEESLNLPVYSSKDPLCPITLPLKSHSPSCVCGYSMDALIKKASTNLLRTSLSLDREESRSSREEKSPVRREGVY